TPRPRTTVHSARIPLPKPRPEEAPKASEEAPPEADGKSAPDTSNANKPAEAAPLPEKQASACRLALTEEIAVAPSIPDIRGPGACGGEDLVRLEAIVLPDKRRVAVKPAAILRCTMASAIADWVRKD
ncbi:extensin family protein, partial [Xanthomonas citri pv. citri]